MKKFFNIFRRKKFIQSVNTNLTVLVINDGETYLQYALGITDERLIFLRYQLEIINNKNSNQIHIALHEFSKYCKHPNELAFFCYTLGAEHILQSNPQLKYKQ